jgi:hypothetical protein
VSRPLSFAMLRADSWMRRTDQPVTSQYARGLVLRLRLSADDLCMHLLHRFPLRQAHSADTASQRIPKPNGRQSHLCRHGQVRNIDPGGEHEVAVMIGTQHGARKRRECETYLRLHIMNRYTVGEDSCFSLHSLLQCLACIESDACIDDVGRATLTAARSAGASCRCRPSSRRSCELYHNCTQTTGAQQVEMQHKTMMGKAEGEKLNSSSGLCRLR